MKDKDSSTKGFYKHEKLGLVPIGWDVVKLGSSFDFFPTASYARALLSENGDCGYIHYGDIHTRFDRFIDAETDTLPCISEDMAKRYTPIIDGDLIISDASEDYEGVGKSVEVINVGEKIIISGLHTLHLRVKNNEFIKGFKGYILNQEKVRNSILRIATGIKVYSVSKTELKKIYLPKPPEDEQIQITNILSLVDSAIQATQNSIKAAEKLKKGLMQNLLTGKLKPDGTWRTKDEFYKDEKFGNIPIGWKPIKGKYLFKIHGSVSLSQIVQVIKGDSLYMKVEDFNNDANTYFIKESQITFNSNETKAKLIKPNYIIVSKRGEAIKKNRVRIASKNIALDPNLMGIELLNNNNPHFFKALLEYINLGRFCENAGIPQLNNKDFYPKYFVIPNDNKEQEAIAKRIIEVFEFIELRTQKILKLNKLKKSLIQNLLSGKVRLIVNILKEHKNI